jgi:saccharopine dehydrogenase-like NADP-dependent oxidoreductase
MRPDGVSWVRFVVLGGAGHMGSHIARYLLEVSDGDVVIADYQAAKAHDLARELGSRVDATYVDARNRDSLLLALRDADVAIGAVGPFYQFAPKMAWAALESGVQYIDICDDYSPIDILFEFDAVARRSGTTVITGLGWTPGLSNVLARHGAEQLDTVREVRIAWVGGAADAEGRAVIKHVLHAVSGQIPTYRNGQVVSVPAMSEPELVNFPEPLGATEVFHVGHPEPLTIPRSIPAPLVSLKGALTPRWNNWLAKSLVSSGLTSSQRRIDQLTGLVHRLEGVIGTGGIALSGLRVDVAGIRGEELVTLSYSTVDRMARLTAIPAAVGAVMLAGGEIESPGVFAPEAIIDPAQFLEALAAQGIDIQVSESATGVTAPQAPLVATEVAPAPPIPAAQLADGTVAKVVLAVEQRAVLQLRRPHLPSAALSDGQVAAVHLNLDGQTKNQET